MSKATKPRHKVVISYVPCTSRRRWSWPPHLPVSCNTQWALTLSHFSETLFDHSFVHSQHVSYALFSYISVSLNLSYGYQVLQIIFPHFLLQKCQLLPFFPIFSKNLFVAHVFSSWYPQYVSVEPNFCGFKSLEYKRIRNDIAFNLL